MGVIEFTDCITERISFKMLHVKSVKNAKSSNVLGYLLHPN